MLLFAPASTQPVSSSEHFARSPLSAENQSFGNYILLLSHPAAVEYRGGVAGLRASAPEPGHKLDSKAPEVQAYVRYLDAQMDGFVAGLEKTLARQVRQLGRTHYLAAGLVLELSEAEAQAVERLPGFLKVFKETIETVDTDSGPTWIGAPQVWDGSRVPGNLGAMGEGILVGVIDTGVNSDHPSFADLGGDGYDHSLPPGMGVYVGVCDPADPTYDPSFACNDKLVGAWEFSYYYYDAADPQLLEYPTPEDEVGHGSHTASTAVGNIITATLSAPTIGFQQRISGVAPHANLIIYDVCYANIITGRSACPGGALFDAVDQAFADGVDVINYSISGGENPSEDYMEFMFARIAMYHNTFISTSAGNSGGVSTVAHRSPWVATVAASTHDRDYSNDLSGMAGGSTAPPGDMVGKGITSGLGPTPIVYAGDYAASTPGTPSTEAARLCAPGYFSPGTFNGEIVVCDRGNYTPVNKAAEAKRAGAGGFVLANDISSGSALISEPYVLPGVQLTYADGLALKSWLTGGSGHTASISGIYRDLDPLRADLTAGFSSRGPNPAFDVLKPEVTAPGVYIYAAVQTRNPLDPPEFGYYNGTSMAAPHNAGAGALLKQVFPTLDAMSLRSALMLTAHPLASSNRINESGAGRIDLTRAALSGLVMPQAITPMYDAFYNGSGQDVRSFNLASIMDTRCVVRCTWTRTFASSLAFTASYTTTFESYTNNFYVEIVPATFELGPGETQVVTFTMDVSQVAIGSYAQGSAWLNTNASFPASLDAPFGGEAVSDAHLPILVRSSASNLPASIAVTAYDVTSTHEISGVVSLDVSSMIVSTYGLAQAAVTHKMLAGDPTAGNPYDLAGGGAFYTLVPVPANTLRFVAEVVHATATDVDMFIGRDTNGDGLPQSSERFASSATSAALEYYNLTNPGQGTYWVLVQNYEDSGDTLDLVSLATAVVPTASSGNLVVTAPPTAAAGVPYSVFLNWDLPTLLPGERYYGAFSLGRNTPGDLGTSNIEFHHTYSSLFAYYDGEGVVDTVQGETVNLAGDFNGWDVINYPMADQGSGLYAYYAFNMTRCDHPDNPSSYEYVVVDASASSAWDFLNTNPRSAVFCTDHEDLHVDWRNIEPVYYQLFGTSPVTVTLGSGVVPTYTVSIGAGDLTAQTGAPRGLLVDLGIGTSPDVTAWTLWSALDWVQQAGNYDNFSASLPVLPTIPSQYSLVGRINGNWAWGNPNDEWTYVDLDWTDPNFSIGNAAVLNVWMQLFVPFLRK